MLAARDTFKITLSSIGDGVVSTDAEGRVTYLNPVAERLTGWPDSAAQGKAIEEVVVLIREDNDEPVENPVTHALRVGQVVGLANHTLLVSRDGRRIPIDDSAAPIRDGNDTITGGVLVFRDISERRKKEELEREHQDHFRESARLESLGRMAGGIAHDFNNLLTAVLGNASLLAETAVPEDVPIVSEIIEAAERAAALTKQMLAYSGKEWLDMVALDLNAHVGNNLSTMRASLPGNVSFEVELGPPGYAVRADAIQFQQVILNILTNAAEALENRPGRISIRTGVVIDRPGRLSPHLSYPVPAGTYGLIEIRDNGIGMSPEVLRKIFDPFFTTKFTGRGLGLAALVGLVKGHQGDIGVQSKPGVGTSFRVFLPATPLSVPERD